MSNNNPILPIGGVIALVILLSALFTQKSCNFNCTTASETPSSRPRQFQELSKDEKRAAFEQLLNDPDKRDQILSILSNDFKFNRFLENIKADSETIEVLNDLRQTHQFKFNFEVQNEDPIITIESGEVPKFKPAKFKKIKANANEVDTTHLPIEK